MLLTWSSSVCTKLELDGVPVKTRLSKGVLGRGTPGATILFDRAWWIPGTKILLIWILTLRKCYKREWPEGICNY